MQRDKFLKTLKFKFLSSFLTKDCCLSAFANALKGFFRLTQKQSKIFYFFLAFFLRLRYVESTFLFYGGEAGKIELGKIGILASA